jgi:hypothetical protein
MDTLQKVDHSALKTNQAAIISLSILAFILDAYWLVLFVTLAMALGTILKVPAFAFLYKSMLKPLGWVRPDVRLDNPEPHRFSQGLGAVFLASGGLVLYSGVVLLGWALVWLVIFLAALNLFAGFCAGCMVYYWLSRLEVPGFEKSPPTGAFPGMRPDTKVGHEP